MTQFPLVVIRSFPIQRDHAILQMEGLAADLNRKFGFFGPTCCLVGSCEIQGEGNDVDVMVSAFAAHHADPIADYLKSTGFIEQEVLDSEEYGPGDFRSLRKNDVNVLLVWESDVRDKWIAAVEVCKYVETKTREQRVAIHKIIMDGEHADQQG